MFGTAAVLATFLLAHLVQSHKIQISVCAQSVLCIWPVKMACYLQLPNYGRIWESHIYVGQLQAHKGEAANGKA